MHVLSQQYNTVTMSFPRHDHMALKTSHNIASGLIMYDNVISKVNTRQCNSSRHVFLCIINETKAHIY